MRIFLPISLILIISLHTAAQNITIKGNIADTTAHISLSNAVIAVLRANDSVLLQFTRSHKNGGFELNTLPGIKSFIMVSYPNYADFIDTLFIQPGQTVIDLGTIYLETKAHLLQEIIVQQRVAAIKVRGDTTEFKADSFHTGPNANVQDLLKQLPGIQVNAKGEITAQGERVRKVLVDGEEFFSDDPAVVTQNLRADYVDKVQVYDKKSDQAVFSGIDDGQKTKTINLTLKEDKKKGYFGKVEAGTDATQYHYEKAMVNSFQKKRKFAAYVTNDNTRYESLNWNEKSNYGNDLNRNTDVQDDGSVWISQTSDEFSSGAGLPNSTTAGATYGNKWNEDKQNINGTYQYNHLNIVGQTNSITQYILPDTTFINKVQQNANNIRQRHRMNAVYEWQIDSTSSLKVTVTGSQIKRNDNNLYTGQSISQEGQIINQTDRTTTLDGTENNFLSNIFWRKKYKKAGRTLSFNGNLNFSGRNNTGFLTAQNSFYDKTGFLSSAQNINQYKTNSENLSGADGKFVYTEPLWKKIFLELNYRFGFSGNDAIRNTFAKDSVNGQYDIGVDSLTNHFKYNINSQSGGATFRYNAKKINFSAGTGIGITSFRLNDILQNTNRTIQFTNFLPTASVNFTPKTQRKISLTYTGSTRNPSLVQIQPFVDNTDPLNINIGNPNLKQEFNHRFQLSVSDFKVLKSRNIYVSGNFNLTNNAISSSSTVDSSGRRINQAVNVDGNYSGNIFMFYSFEIVPTWIGGFSSTPGVNRYINFINGKKNINDNRNINFGVYFGRWSNKNVNFYVNADFSRNYSRSSISPNNITRYWSYTPYINFTAKLPAKLYFEANSNITIYEKTSVFTGNADVYLVNASLKKTFSKNDNWELKFSVNDLLNQNKGINRNISSNFIAQTTQQTIQRYFLLSLAYNFNKNGKPAQ
ncbi:outer membrane beta-barrel family protein [Hydrotalea sp.]|uniref:outer membrane beta-barrel family protein n=1 Tax=Hydrotalea sp. TaxID=2881279 RepID=UPI002604CDE2|nr:outer membrane beta-barrel family protein [Hydrotalea sp.]